MELITTGGDIPPERALCVFWRYGQRHPVPRDPLRDARTFQERKPLAMFGTRPRMASASAHCQFDSGALTSLPSLAP